ncbi:MAG: LacI family DNA-binding transcriptional regulator [Oscillospiraceae bacterium]
MSSIKDVAKEAGVSIATVSRVINGTKRVSDDVRARVEQAIHDLDYRSNEIARTLKMTKTNRIAVIITSLSRSFFSRVIEGIQSEAEKHSYSVVFAETHDSIAKEQELVELFAGQWVDGIILASSVNNESAHSEYITRLAGLNKQGTRIPVVTLEFPLNNDGIDAVCIDHEKAAYDAVRYLISLGKTRIAHISHPKGNRIGSWRVKGYESAMKDAGLKLKKSFISEANYTTYSGYLAMSKLVSGGIYPDAVFCANDQTAVGVIKYCEDNNLRVPEDVAIIGTDDIFVASIMSPSLSTVDVPKFQLGRQAMSILHTRITDGEPTYQRAIRYLDYTIVERESTKRGAKASLQIVQW